VTDWFVPGLKVGEDETLLEGDRRQEMDEEFGLLLEHYMGHGVVRHTREVLPDTCKSYITLTVYYMCQQ